MFNTLLGGVLCVIGIYNIATYTGDLTPLFYLKFGGMTLVGGAVSLYGLVPTLYKSLSNIKLPQATEKVAVEEVKEVPMAKELSKEIKIEDVQEQDMVCIFYLTERLKGMAEGPEVCRKVNDMLFSLHHPQKDVKGA